LVVYREKEANQLLKAPASSLNEGKVWFNCYLKSYTNISLNTIIFEPYFLVVAKAPWSSLKWISWYRLDNLIKSNFLHLKTTMSFYILWCPYKLGSFCLCFRSNWIFFKENNPLKKLWYFKIVLYLKGAIK
jgi:hypothetical protein